MSRNEAVPFNPYDDPVHPSNWPAWKRHAQLVTLAWASFAVNFLAGAHLPIFEPIAEEFEVSITAVANTIGIGILGLGVGCLLWSPLSSAYGRRPVYVALHTLLVPLTCWIAFAPNFDNFAAARFFTCLCGSAVQILPIASITELYKPEWRGTAISFWSLLLILGPPLAPLITAGDTEGNDWRWSYYVCIIFVGSVWIMTLLFCQETLYTPPVQQQSVTPAPAGDGTTPNDDKKEGVIQNGTKDVELAPHGGSLHGKIGAVYNPFKEPKRFFLAFIEPFAMALYIPELLCALWGSFIFSVSVGFTIVLPQMLPRPPYGFSTISVGLAFLPALVGAVLGKFYGGVGSDWTVSYFARKYQTGREPEYRLWNMIPMIVLHVVGCVIFGWGLGNYEKWWVAVIFGIGIYYGAMVSVTGALQTYMSECYLSKGLASLNLYNFCKCVLAFGTPFYIADWAELPKWVMGDGTGFKNSYLTQGILCTFLGLAMVIYLIIYGKRVRAWQGMPLTAPAASN